MADRRMFAKTIIDSDAFLEMPSTSQMLYFHLAMRADDDGFINNPKRIMRMIGASDDDMKILIVKNFIITFESGVIVIKHWRIHNLLRTDRYKPTVYQEEKAELELKDNGTYTLGIPNGNQMATNWQPNGNQMETQVSIGKVGKVNIKHQHGANKNVLLTDEEFEKLKTQFSDYETRIDNLSFYLASTGKSYKSHYMTILNWARKDSANKQTPVQKPKNSFHNFQERKTDYSAIIEANRMRRG